MFYNKILLQCYYVNITTLIQCVACQFFVIICVIIYAIKSKPFMGWFTQ